MIVAAAACCAFNHPSTSNTSGPSSPLHRKIFHGNAYLCSSTDTRCSSQLLKMDTQIHMSTLDRQLYRYKIFASTQANPCSGGREKRLKHTQTDVKSFYNIQTFFSLFFCFSSCLFFKHKCYTRRTGFSFLLIRFIFFIGCSVCTRQERSR